MYLNAQLWELWDAQEEDLVIALAECILVNMTAHFTPWMWYRGVGIWMWRMSQEGRKVTGKGGLHTQHGQAQLFQHGGAGGTTTHIPFDVTCSALRGGRAVEPQINMGKDTVVDGVTGGETIARGGSGFCDAQRKGR